MALSVAVGSFNIGTGAIGTTTTITPGFEVKALILWWNGRTESTDAGGSATHTRGMGFATSASAFRAWASHDVDAGGSADTDCGYRLDACILQISNTAFVGKADVQSISSTQVVFEILTQFTIDFRVFYLALGGDDITGAEIGTFTPTGAAPVNQIVNTTNQGKLIFFGGVARNAESVLTHSRSFFGAATSSSSEYVWAGGAENGAGIGNTRSYSLASECIATLAAATDVCEDRAEFVSFNATPSFTINWLERTNAFTTFYLLLAGDFQVTLGDLLTTTGTGTITESGLAFQPTALLLASGCKAASTADTPAASDELSLGAATASNNEVCCQSSSRDGNTSMFVQTGVDYDSIYQNRDVAADTVEGAADFTGFTSDGFTLNMSDGDPVASFAWYVALASEPSADNWFPTQRTSPGARANLRR